MDRVSVRIQMRVDFPLLELALTSVLDGTYEPAYFKELALTQCQGPVRIKKLVTLLNLLTVNGKWMPYMMEHKEEVRALLRVPEDRALLFISLLSSEYSFVYDTIRILGRYLHAQDVVDRSLVVQKLAEKYGSNGQLDVSFRCVIPMLIEAGMIKRTGKNQYAITRLDKFSQEALEIYRQSFLQNNPAYTPDMDLMSNPYFEFLNQ